MKKSREIISPLNRESEEMLLVFLKRDLKKIGLYDSSVEIKIRPFSKTFEGRYFIKSQRIFLYPYDREGRYDYAEVFKTLVHEMIHHLQYQNPSYERVKGVMHNAEFYKLYEHYIKKARERIESFRG